MVLRFTVFLLFALATSSTAHAQMLTLVRQEAGRYVFETRVDTTDLGDKYDAACRRESLLFGDCMDESRFEQGPWLVVLHDGVAVDSISGMQVWIGAEPDTVAIAARGDLAAWPVRLPVPDGAIQDLTGDGVPEVVVAAYSGGAHCCTTLWVISLGDTPEHIATINAADSEVRLADLDGDGRAEFELNDFAYAYWNTSFAGSPAPRVVLAWEGQEFAPSQQHMRTGPLPQANLELAIRSVRLADSWRLRRFPPEEYWGTLLDLLYAANTEQAVLFSQRAWVGDPMSRSIFLAWLRDLMYTSPYASAVLDMNDNFASALFEPGP